MAFFAHQALFCDSVTDSFSASMQQSTLMVMACKNRGVRLSEDHRERSEREGGILI